MKDNNLEKFSNKIDKVNGTSTNSSNEIDNITPSSKCFDELFCKVYGVPYDFRFKTAGDKVAFDVKNILKMENIDPTVYSCYQTHSKNVRIIGKDKANDFVYGKIFMDSDGIVTDKKNELILIKFADCTPIVFYENNRKILGACHSGWRGTVGRVSKSTVDAIESLGGSVKNIHAYIGPSIGQENYEVGRDVYDEFSKISEDVEGILDAFVKSEIKEDKFYLNMKLANFLILKSIGIKEENIEIAEEFTFENPHIHSAREEGEGYGLNAILTMMK
ncbi:polyphenol oxidase family protein [Peptoniphilus sp.]|uniref:polyphenol oxidase family protein n=1 Tax=Peptoniphilus sp. TaxID=1971214 RepID=UPI0039940855